MNEIMCEIVKKKEKIYINSISESKTTMNKFYYN